MEFLGGSILANGGKGGDGIGDGGGGVLLHAYQVYFDTDTRIRANGGTPNAGGGRIMVVTNADGTLADWTIPGHTAGSLVSGDITATGLSGSDGPIDLLTDPNVGTAPSRASLPLAPDSYASLGQLPGGSFIVNTSDMTYDGVPGGVVQPQFDGPPIAVFTFDGGTTISTGSTITIEGGRPAALLFQGPITLSASIIASGHDDSSPVIGGDPGPGGGRGGRGSSNCSTIELGAALVEVEREGIPPARALPVLATVARLVVTVEMSTQISVAPVIATFAMPSKAAVAAAGVVTGCATVETLAEAEAAVAVPLK